MNNTQFYTNGGPAYCSICYSNMTVPYVVLQSPFSNIREDLLTSQDSRVETDHTPHSKS